MQHVLDQLSITDSEHYEVVERLRHPAVVKYLQYLQANTSHQTTKLPTLDPNRPAVDQAVFVAHNLAFIQGSANILQQLLDIKHINEPSQQ